MELSLFDLHCDTAYELCRRSVHIADNTDCHISLDRAEVYQHYAQFYAIWSDKRLDNELCWQEFLRITDYMAAELTHCADRATAVKTASDLETAICARRHAALLAVEDARLLNGYIERLDELSTRGVRYLTLTWGGESCIGGAHDTDLGLTDFGKAVVRGCMKRGIIPDISHASEASAADILTIASDYGRPVIASHSNAHRVYAHTRNLRDDQFAAVRASGGVVGVSLCPMHLCNQGRDIATAETVFAHFEHYLALGGEDMIGFGGDWDGTVLPSSFSHIGHLVSVAEVMAAHNYSDQLIHKLFWQNFYSFAIKNI